MYTKIPFTLIAGPCVIESESMILEIAEELKMICERVGIKLIFKASFDKANRSSLTSYRGPGIKKGLEILYEVKRKFGLEILTDIHETSQAKDVSEVVDVLQIPAFLCRQSDLLLSAYSAIKNTNKVINIKKGQFLAPWDMNQVVNKLFESGLKVESGQLWLTERGTSFGYNNLVVDFRSLVKLAELKCPVIFDATHSVQQPGGLGSRSGGQREYVAPLARAAVAVGVDGLFMEVHPDPENALSDGPNMVPLEKFESLLKQLIQIKNITSNKLASSSL